MSLNAYKSIIMVSRVDDQESILDLMQTMYDTDPKTEFSFLNIYKELPITSYGTIFEIKESTVEFITNEIQFSAISEAKEVLIQSNLMNKSILGKAIDFDNRRLQVTLGEFTFAEVHVDKRTSVRVRLRLPMNVQMAIDGNQLAGVIRDISLGGVCVTTFAGDFLEKASNIELRIKLLHQGTNELMETLIPSRLARIDRTGVQTHCALVFNHTPQSERVLSTFIYQRQLEIIKELKHKN